MKELHILRHAKSSWVNSNLTDYDRPLSKKGINDAINLSIYIERNNISVDRILCSSAERTKQTCDLVYRSTRVNQKEILYTDKLYYQNRETIKNIKRDYNKLKDVLGISKVIDPRKITVSKILKHVHRGRIESVYSIGNNQAELIHAQALKSSKLLNKSIKESNLPNGMRIGLMKKREQIIIPNKETIIEENDEILFFCMTEDLKNAEDLFKIREAY